MRAQRQTVSFFFFNVDEVLRSRRLSKAPVENAKK